VQLQQEAVLAGDAVAGDHFRCSARDLRDLAQLLRGRADPDDRADRIAERLRLDVGVVAGDDAAALEARHAFADGGRGQADAPAELGVADPRVALKLGEDQTVDRVKFRCFKGTSAFCPWLRSHVA
jgi:hypothetical protein